LLSVAPFFGEGFDGAYGIGPVWKLFTSPASPSTGSSIGSAIDDDALTSAGKMLAIIIPATKIAKNDN